MNCTTEEVAKLIRSISALRVAKNIFDGMVLLFVWKSHNVKIAGVPFII